MSLRQRLQHDRMTVRPVEAGDEADRYGLLWRIRGPVANESPATRRARELSITASALAWCPLIGLGVFLARRLLAFDSPGLWLVLGAVLAIQGFAIYLDYLLARPLFRRPRRAAVAWLALVLIILSGGRDVRGAVFVHLPLTLAGGAFLARLMAAQHLRWLAEAPRLSWEERDRRRSEAARLPLIGVRLVLSCAIAVFAFEFAQRNQPPTSAGAVAVLILFVSPWILLELSGCSVFRAAASAWEIIVVWFSYNHHEWYGPQTFQFDGCVRKPIIRKASVWAVTTLLAAAVVCVTSAPPWDALRAVSSAIADPPQVFRKTWPQLDRPSDEVRMSREQERYYKLLPTDSEKRRYRESLTRRSIAHEHAVDSARGGGSIEDLIRSLVLTVLAPPLLLFTILACSHGQVIGVLKSE